MTGKPTVLFVCVGQDIEAVRPIRDEIERRVKALVPDLLGATA